MSSVEFAQGLESELPAIAALLHNTFGTNDTYRVFRPEVMRWKCHAPHPLWNGSRSYVVRYQGEVAGCGCMVPMELLTPAGDVLRAGVVIDWAGSRAVPGSGALIYRGLQDLVDVLMGIGGSDDARAIIPRMGFKVRSSIENSVRVTRPVTHMFHSRPLTWKSPLRAGRDSLQLIKPSTSVPQSWSAKPVQRFDASVNPVLPVPRAGIVARRTPELLNYYLDCPASAMRGFLLSLDQRLQGYFILSRVGRETRIAELWITSAEEADWRAAYALAARLASKEDGTTEISARAALPVERSAVAAAGFRVIASDPVFVKDPKKKLPADIALGVGAMANDAFYL